MKNQRVFIDTNLWLYALLEGQDEGKAALFRQRLSLVQRPVISSQVVSECIANLIKKAKCPPVKLQQHCGDLCLGCEIVPIEVTILRKSCAIFQPGVWSWWDTLIIASALESGCDELWSEDLQDGRMIEGRLQIKNPLIAQK